MRLSQKPDKGHMLYRRQGRTWGTGAGSNRARVWWLSAPSSSEEEQVHGERLLCEAPVSSVPQSIQMQIETSGEKPHHRKHIFKEYAILCGVGTDLNHKGEGIQNDRAKGMNAEHRLKKVAGLQK